MVSNMKELKKPKCQKGIREHVQGAIMNIKADPVTYAACVSDVELICPNVLPGQGRVHKCLLQNIEEVSPTCKMEEFKQQQLLAADVTLSPLVMRFCKTAITANCKDMQSDGAKLWECLEDLARKPIGSQKDFSTRCRQEVVYHTRLKNSELHLNPKLYEKCKADFLKLCDEELRIAEEKAFTSYGSAIGCLIKKRATVKDDTCKAEMLRTMKQRVADIEANPKAHEYCRNDIETLCSEHKGPNVVRKCLINRFKELGEYCQDMIGEMMKMQSEDIELQPGLKSACMREKKTLCSDVPKKPGLMQACLMKHLHDVDMQPDCKKKLEEKLAKQSKSILLNPVLLQKCKGEFEKLRDKQLCKGLGLESGKVEDITTLNPAEILKRPELHGQIRQCLLNRRANISSTMCKAQLTVEMAAQSNDIRHNAVIFKTCKTDMEELCKDLQHGRGRGLKCLSDNAQKIKNERCKPLVAEMIKHQLQDATINPGIVRNCQLEQKAFCQGIEHGRARILKCLASNMNETSFGADCRMAMFDIRAESLIKAKIDDKVGYKEVLKWLEVNGSSGKGMVTGAIAGCLVALALCSACFLAFRKGVFGKQGYAVVPRALDA
jgi:Golgi apparatus protein 1